MGSFQPPDALVVGDGGAHTKMEEVVLPEAMRAATLAPQPLLKRKGPPVLPWMRSPAEIGVHERLPLGQVPLLDSRLQEAMRATGIEALFPVQVAVWNQVLGPGGCERDLCVCSPTGSGKTLCYVLPVVQMLSTRVLRRLRALVVLPTRDLAIQVKKVFDTLAPAVGLSVGLAVGQSSVAAEAAELVQISSKMVHSFGSDGPCDKSDVESCIDILVATPGRLMDHLRSTSGFTIEHLQYLLLLAIVVLSSGNITMKLSLEAADLCWTPMKVAEFLFDLQQMAEATVVDETDRLLRQAYQDWLPNVLQVLQVPLYSERERRKSLCLQGIGPLPTCRHWCLERGLKGRVHPRVMKFVLSATLTRDPAKIAQLDLYCPMYVAPSAAENRYQLPKHLEAFKLVCKASTKLLTLVTLLEQLKNQPTIIFNASVEATHQLFMLLRLVYYDEESRVAEYSSKQPQNVRRKALADFMAGRVQVLVASDAMTRGMDVEGVANVINYDVPVYAKTYVHRVGRTARAGEAGRAFTLLLKKEARHFKKELLSKLENGRCLDHELPASLMEELLPRLTAAQEAVKNNASMEDTEDGSAREPILEGNSAVAIQT